MKNNKSTVTKTTTTTTTTEPSKMAKTIRVIGGIALIGGIVYIIYNLIKRQPKSVKGAVTDLRDTIVLAPTDLKTSLTGKYKECGFPLKKGCGGENVEKLQRFLNREGGYNLIVDGKFGDLTENAVIDNQSPFPTFKSMYPKAVKGQVSKEFFDSYIINA